MGVGIENPDDLDPGLADIIPDAIGIAGGDGTGAGIEVPDRIDHGTLLGGGIVEDGLPVASSQKLATMGEAGVGVSGIQRSVASRANWATSPVGGEAGGSAAAGWAASSVDCSAVPQKICCSMAITAAARPSLTA